MNPTDIDTTKLLIVFAQQLIQHLTVVALLGDESLNRLGSFLSPHGAQLIGNRLQDNAGIVFGLGGLAHGSKHIYGCLSIEYPLFEIKLDYWLMFIPQPKLIRNWKSTLR